MDTYNFKIVKAESQCFGCDFSISKGCFCPDDFPTEECKQDEIIKLEKGSKIIDPIVNGIKTYIKREF